MAPPGQTTKLASGPEDTTSSDAAREGLLRAQSQKMQDTLPVGPEGAMPPSARGAAILDLIRQKQQSASPAGMALPAAENAPPPMPPGQEMQPPMPPPAPMAGAAPAMPPGQPDMMNQQNRWQEVIKRLQQAQQGVGAQPPQPGMM